MNIIESNGNFQIYNSIEILNELPKGVYAFDCGRSGPFLSKMENLYRPKKVYSNDKIFLKHVLHTWNHSDDSLGILLTGKKGLGKSFTANLLCTMLPDLPVIKITREVGKGEGLIDFLNEIKQDHIIYIDEFEKIFTEKDAADDARLNQKVFLSFLDGGNTSAVKKLFIITTNNEVNDLFINRPTRLRYVREYNSLDLDVIKEVIEDRLINKDFLKDLLEYVDQDNLNIDILIKVIDEINLHNIPYSTFREFFNYKSIDRSYNVVVKLPNVDKPLRCNTINQYVLNLLKNNTTTQQDFGYLIHNEIIAPNLHSNDDYYIHWNGESKIKKIDDNNYELEASCTHYNNHEEDKKNTIFPVTLYISKQITYLTL